MRSELEIKALHTAASFHEGQKRKGEDVPYIVHPVEVALILQQEEMEEEIIAAGFLHDILEDTAMKKNELGNIFNERILRLVVGASERLKDREKREWKERKLHTVKELKSQPREIKYIVCADKLSNARSMLRNFYRIGNELWARFNAGRQQQQWYYNGLSDSLKELEGRAMYEEFKEVVEELFSASDQLKLKFK